MVVVRTQPNALIHLCAVVCVCTAGWLLKLNAPEWALISLAIAGVWTAECLNTALEFLSDQVSPNYCPLIRDAKDVAAAGVFIASCASAIVGFLIVASKITK